MITIPETEISSRGLHALHRALQERRLALDHSGTIAGTQILHDVLLELEAATLFGAELLELEPEKPIAYADLKAGDFKVRIR